MALVNWNDSFSVKIKQFDNQHKKLFDLINQLHDAMMVGKGKDVVGDVLKSLADYTRTHFADEERLLKMYQYPEFDRQQKEHATFVQQITNLQKTLQEGNAAITQTTMGVLRDWLQKHINGDDKKYSAYLNGKGVS